MGRYAAEGEGRNFQDPPVGTHVARCFGLIDIGTQHGEYKGKPTVRNQVIVQWELCDEFMDADEDGNVKPFVTSRFYTNDLYEKSNLSKDLVAWRGRPFTPEEKREFDLEQILDKPCLITLAENENGKVRVTGVAKLVKGQQAAPLFNKKRAFWIDPWDQKAFDELSEGFQRLVMTSDEYKAMKAPPQRPNGKQQAKQAVPAGDDFDDDIPF